MLASLPRVVARYYRDFVSVRVRGVPTGERDFYAWAFSQFVRMWSTRVPGSPDAFNRFMPLEPVPAIASTPLRLEASLALWPLIAAYVAYDPDPHAWYRAWKGAIARPDLILDLHRGPLPDRVYESTVTYMPSFAAHQYAFVHGPPDDIWELESKLAFAAACARHNLPGVQDVEFGDVVDDHEYIAKPKLGAMGVGIFAVCGRDVPSRVDPSTHFLQRRLMNHRELRRLVGEDGALSTLRLSTLLTSNGRMQCPEAYLRMGQAGAVVDNLSAGGMVAAIDPHTGRIGPAGSAETMRGRWVDAFRITSHPVTGVKFADSFVVPGFDEARELCQRAHLLLAPHMPRVSWDVAQTDAGPALVEAAVGYGGFWFEADDETRRGFFDALLAVVNRARVGP